jgi:GGDEF domain-containing protein
VAGLLAGAVRSSDFVSSLADGTLIVLAPEENNLVSHFERRLAAMVRDLMDDPTLPLTVGHVLYPGHHDEPRAVLAAATAALSHVK